MSILRSCLVALLVVLGAAAVAGAQEHTDEFENLMVLPSDISSDSLRTLMNSFTRALGVRCAFCHVGEEGKPMQHEDFPKDDKPTKAKARDMMQMTQAINDKYLADLPHRLDPPIRVQCVTCHHGVSQPRTLQDILKTAYASGGMDSTLTKYQALRDRYYGRFAYDFGEVPLADVAAQLRTTGHTADAESLLSLDVQLNPKSAFAKRQHANVALEQAFVAGADPGATAYRDFKTRYGADVINEAFLNEVAYNLLAMKQPDAAIAAFQLNVVENPTSGNAYDSLGEGYLAKGDRKRAKAAYEKSLKLDPKNDNAKEKLEEIKKMK